MKDRVQAVPAGCSVAGSDLVLGIDGGGTKTVAWLALREIDSPGVFTRDPRSHSAAAEASDLHLIGQANDADFERRHGILGRGHAGPSNQRAVGASTAIRNLESAVAGAFAAAGLASVQVHSACLGLAGADRATDRSVIEIWAHDAKLAGHVRVVNDAMPLLYASDGLTHSAGIGIALICGTGSMAFGANRHGESGRSGGWGYLIGDEGSAYRIGQAAVQAVSRTVDRRGSETELLRRIVDKLGIHHPSELVDAIYGASSPKSAIADLASEVFSAAASDAVADEIIRQAQCDLAGLVSSLAHRLALHDDLSLALTGGVLLNQTRFRDGLLNQLADEGISVTSTRLVHDAVLGAVAMARESGSPRFRN